MKVISNLTIDLSDWLSKSSSRRYLAYRVQILRVELYPDQWQQGTIEGERSDDVFLEGGGGLFFLLTFRTPLFAPT